MNKLLNWKLLLLGIGFILTPSAANGQVEQDQSFAPAPNDWVYTIAQHMDGKILVGGGFTTIGGTTQGYIARLNPDGTVDTNFRPVLNGLVHVITVQLDGKILIGGGFTIIDGVEHKRIARLNSDGSLDSSFNASANGGLVSIVPQPDGRILLSGYFGQVCGESRTGYARIHPDGTLDASFNPMVSVGLRPTMALLSDRKILVATSSPKLIARLNSDGSLDQSFTSSLTRAGNSRVNVMIELADRKIIVGCWLNSNLYRLNPDGTFDVTYSTHTDLWVDSLALQADGHILVGGGFDIIGGLAIPSFARLKPDGTVDTSFTPGADDMIFGITIQPDGKILTGGGVYGQAQGRIARWCNGTAESSLEISSSGQIDWSPSGNMQWFTQAWLEIWQDGQWIALGEASRTSSGWRLPQASLPETGLLRVLGRVTSSVNNGGSSIVSVMLPYSGSGLSLRYDNWPVLPDLSPDRRGMLDTNGPMELPNILAYAMGLHPHHAKASDMLAVSLVEENPNRMALHFRRNTKCQDVSLSVWKSGNLAPDSWSPAFSLGETITESGQGWEVIRTEVETPSAQNGFFRLKANFLE